MELLEELSKINSQHRILHIVNFKKSIELISLLTKSIKKGIIYKGIQIQKLTIITDASYNQIPNEFKNNYLIIEACNKYRSPKSLNYIPETYAEKVKSHFNFTKECEAAKYQYNGIMKFHIHRFYRAKDPPNSLFSKLNYPRF